MTYVVNPSCFKRVTDTLAAYITVYTCIINAASSIQLIIPFQPWKYLALASMGWAFDALFHIKISSKSAKMQTLVATRMAARNSVIVMVTEMTLNAASRAPRQLKKYGATNNMMVTGHAFSLDTALSAQHRKVRYRTKTINYEHWNQYLHS